LFPRYTLTSVRNSVPPNHSREKNYTARAGRCSLSFTLILSQTLHLIFLLGGFSSGFVFIMSCVIVFVPNFVLVIECYIVERTAGGSTDAECLTKRID